jgi:predicted phosphodiesterase
VAVLSDVHGNPWALRATLDDVRRRGVDLIVNCGDLVAGPWPVEVIDELFGFGLPVVSVRGNGDRTVADAYDGSWNDIHRSAKDMAAWAAARLRPPDREWLGNLPLTIGGLSHFLGPEPRPRRFLML